MDLWSELKRTSVSLAGVGFLVSVVIFARVCEVTPGGLQQDTDEQHAAPVTAHAANKRNLVVMALPVIAIALDKSDRIPGNNGPAAVNFDRHRDYQAIKAIEEKHRRKGKAS
ncbi:MAG: hypothetical protein HKN70_05250 [Gammaproteobacteria bacterium]|nr:hypothetical protein [Gammaproteobacteria bacterium]